MERLVPLRDPSAERLVIEPRIGRRLALRVERARGENLTLRLTYAEANRLAESLREVAGPKIGDQVECGSPGQDES